MSDDSIGSLFETMCQAMVAGDIAELDSLLAEEFTLTHMTGYVQSKAEWLDAIETGEMRYHRMETAEAHSSPEGTAPGLTARTLTDATIWGSRATWRLTLRSWFEPRGEEWIVTRTVASTW
ncbi:nuclear transport factor 2 family protein [Arthrobacter sp. SDTb3-6]|uniref:nuclear transport factor 2 family protein n=1 Tax=Arthrobacter sp. SDTb3-6 TaxID=2713571 RepID=UPI00159EB2D2|nr:nuclear transport factor 2 family protein [Arthrobacter sp. SDTb3-6]